MLTVIFGGSFDPIHKGHIALAKAALEFLGADRVIMIPADVSPFKTDNRPVDFKSRYEMCKIAVEQDNNIIVSDVESRLPKPSYTVNTVEKLKQMYPDDTFVLLCGSDAFVDFDKWKDYRKILSYSDILTTLRSDKDFDLMQQKKALFEQFGKVYFMDMPKVEVSSTKVREVAKNGEDLDNYLPGKVAEYIKSNNLYRG